MSCLTEEKVRSVIDKKNSSDVRIGKAAADGTLSVFILIMAFILKLTFRGCADSYLAARTMEEWVSRKVKDELAHYLGLRC